MLYFFRKNKTEGFFIMTLYEELYFEIRATGAKSEVRNFINYLKSGELDEFFEFSSEYISYDDEYATADESAEVSVIIANDDYGIEIDEFHTDEFLEVLCKAGSAFTLRVSSMMQTTRSIPLSAKAATHITQMPCLFKTSTRMKTDLLKTTRMRTRNNNIQRPHIAVAFLF